MADILRDIVVVVLFAVVCTHPRAIPLAMKTMRKSIHRFPLLCYMRMGLCPSGALSAGQPRSQGFSLEGGKALGTRSSAVLL